MIERGRELEKVENESDRVKESGKKRGRVIKMLLDLPPCSWVI